MRIAILSDIHANREAFEAVLADLGQREIDRMVFLGDMVGYGPDPGWCLDRVMALRDEGALCLRGNHDRAVSAPDTRLNVHARRVIDWTVDQLNPAQKAFLADLPLVQEMGEVLFVHASAADPAAWTYVTDLASAAACLAATQRRLVVCGHVHRATVYSQDPAGRLTSHRFATGLPLPLLRSRRWLTVVGSVGQPRDGSGLAGYAILDMRANEITLRRIGYDSALTARKMRGAGLPETLAARLILGS